LIIYVSFMENVIRSLPGCSKEQAKLKIK